MLRSPLDLYSIATKEKSVDKISTDWIVYSGHRTSRQSNVHPKSPDPARVEELSKVDILNEGLVEFSQAEFKNSVFTKLPLSYIFIFN